MSPLAFTRVEAAASWTLPAVATVFTGLYPRSHGVVGPSPDGQHADAVDPAFLSDALVTMAEVAQHAGITTVGVSSNPLISRATNFARTCWQALTSWHRACGHEWSRLV